MAAGTTVIGLFAPTDYLIAYSQVAAGIFAVTVGLYLLLVVSWYEPQANDPRTPRLYTLIRREARGRALRTVASGTAVAMVIGLLFSTMLLTNGAAYSIDSARSKLGADIIVIPQQAQLSSQPFYTLTYAGNSQLTNGTGIGYSIPPYMNGSVLGQVGAVQGIKEATSQVLATYFQPSGGCGGLAIVYIVGVDPKSDFVLSGWLPANSSQAFVGNGAVAGAEVPATYQLPREGDLYGVKLEVRATLPRTGTFIDHMIFISMDAANRMLRWQNTGNDPAQQSMQRLTFQTGQISAIFVRVSDGVKPADAAARIQANVQGVRAYTFDSIVKASAVQYSGLLSLFSISGAIVWGGSLLLAATIASLSLNERGSEMGLIRALGGSRRFMQKLAATQTILTTTIAGLIAVLFVWITFSSPVMYDSIIITFKLPYVVPSVGDMARYVALAVLIVLATAGAAAMLPTSLVARTDPYEALRSRLR